MVNTNLDIDRDLSKVEDSRGVENFKFLEMDQILDLNDVPWDLSVAHFETIFSNHVIEHVSSMQESMNDVHCIAKKEQLSR